MPWFFSDKKISAKTRSTLRTASGLLSHPKMCPVMQIKFSVTSMVSSVISSEDDVMPPYFFPEGLKVKSNGYIHILSEVVKPWIDQVDTGKLYAQQQHSAPCLA